MRKPSPQPIPEGCPEELKCSYCKEVKPRSKFPRNRHKKYTFNTECLSCHRRRINEAQIRRDIRQKGIEYVCEQAERYNLINAIRYRLIEEHCRWLVLVASRKQKEASQ